MFGICKDPSVASLRVSSAEAGTQNPRWTYYRDAEWHPLSLTDDGSRLVLCNLENLPQTETLLLLEAYDENGRKLWETPVS